MKSSVEYLEPTRVKVSVEAPYEELKPGIDAAYKKFAQQARVPGFRPGKVPPQIIDRRIGRGAVIQEAVNNSIDGLYRQAIETEKLSPLGQPEVEISEVPGLEKAGEGELKFTVECDIVPQFDIPEYSSIQVEVDSFEVADSDLEEELRQLRERFGDLVDVDRPATQGDFVTLSLKASIDGTEVDSADDISYEIGSGRLLEGTDEALDGLSAEETTTFETTLAGGEHAGETALVTVTLNAVKERHLAEVNAEFAELAGGFDAVEELEEDIKSTVTERKQMEQNLQARERLVDVLREKIDPPVPTAFLEAQIEQAKEQQEQHAGDAEAPEDLDTQVKQGIQVQFILDAITEAEEISVEQAELTEYIMNMSQQFGIDPQQLFNNLYSNNQLNMVFSEIRRRKALAAVLAKAEVKDTQGNTVDMTEFTTPGGEDAADSDAVASEQSADNADNSEAHNEDAQSPANIPT